MKRLLYAILLNFCALTICYARPSISDVYGEDGGSRGSDGISTFFFIAFIVIAMITSGSFRQAIGKIVLAFLGFAFISFILMSIFLSVEAAYGKTTAMITVFGPVIYLVYFKKWYK